MGRLDSRDSRLFIALASFLLLALTRESGELGGENISVASYGTVRLLEKTPPRRLRGDWEPTSLLVLVHTQEWENSLAQIMRATNDTTEIDLVTRSGDSITELAAWLGEEALLSPQIHFLDARVDSPWVRDYGPFEVLDEDGEITWLDSLYDAARPVDDSLPEVLGKSQHVRVERLPVSLDGGGMVSNGEGLCAATRASLETAGFDPESAEEIDPFMRQIGCRALAIVPALVGERTGHVDISVQFLSPRLVAVARIDPRNSPVNARLLDHAADTIRRAARRLGQPLDVVRVHMPVSDDGATFYTYINGIRLSGAHVVPSYSAVSPADENSAYADLETALSEVPLLPVPADEMIELAGAIHCIALGLTRGEQNSPTGNHHALLR